ncbi:hypothetical protein GGR58DRAFT_529097 [Xylaria digitata]|nr:hypothetical protein GGR58DRAFT_529097 [Xylaria digitata]
MAQPALGDQSVNPDLMTYLGTENFKGVTGEYEKFQASRPELLNQDKVSPRIFQQIFDNHVVQICINRTYSAQKRNDVWEKFPLLGKDDPKGDELKKVANAAVKSMDSYDRLLRKIVVVIKGCVRRVHWKKHVKNNAQENLGNWLKEKHTYFNDLLGDSLNSGIKPELRSIIAALNKGMKALQVSPSQQPKKSTQATPTGSTNAIQLKTGQKGTYNPKSVTPKTAIPKTATPKTTAPKTGDVGCGDIGCGDVGCGGDVECGGTKRPLDDDEYKSSDGPAMKKLKLDQSATGWWGPQNSKLDCSDQFFDVVNQWKQYLANPTHEPGTIEHCKQMGEYLERALDEVDKRAFIDQLLLRDEWNFRDERLGHARTPSFMRPGCQEAARRLGSITSYFCHPGSNDIKLLLGGGLSYQELSPEDQEPLPAGMLALVHSYNENGGSLRGGGGDDEEGSLEKQQKSIRDHTNLRFRDPDTLWEQLLEDAKYPLDAGLFKIRLEDGRPLMTDPARVGNFIDDLREKMSRSLVLTEWEKAQQQQDVSRIETRINHYAGIVKAARQKAYDFIHRNPDKIFVDQPKLNEEGGKDKSRPRYGKVLDKEFIRALGYAFRARVFHVLSLALYWKLYLRGLRPLSELLTQEAENLRIWDLHEELYMEWENNKWFSLSSKYEITQLETRYESREFLRAVWGRERKAIQEAIDKLKQNPNYYNITVYPTPKSLVGTKKNAGIQAHTPKTPSKAPSKTVASIKDLFDLVGNGQGLLGETGVKEDVKEEIKIEEGEEEETPAMKKAGSVGTTGIDNNNLTHDIMDVDGVAGVTGGLKVEDGDIDDEIQKAGIQIAVDFLENIRDVYQNKLSQIIKQNEELDDQDPGNYNIISRNNIDAMAKNQILWSLGTEIHNLKRSVDPLSEKSYGKGADQNWELPDDETTWANTRPFPVKRGLPLEVTSIGLGPVPGDHWLPDHPRVLLGCLPDFGDDLDVDEESIEPAGSNLFGTGAASGAVGTTKKEPEQQQAGATMKTIVSSQTLTKLRGILKEKNAAELRIRRLTRLQKGGKVLTVKQKKDLDSTRKLKRDYLALYKKLHNKENATIRAQADLIEQEENNRLSLEIQAVEVVVDKELADGIAKQEQHQQAILQVQKAREKVEEELAKNPSAKSMSLADLSNLAKSLSADQPQPQPKPKSKPQSQSQSQSQIAAKGGPLKDAEKFFAEAHAEVVKCEKRANEAETEAKETEEAIKGNMNDAKLKEIEKLAQHKVDERRRKLIDAIGKWRVASEELYVQQKWDDPPETVDALRARLTSLNQDWEDWVDGYDWSNSNDDLVSHNDQWVLETISFMFECCKALGFNPGHELWLPMYENFWASAGDTLERKRKIWLHSLVGHVNHLIQQQEWGGQLKSFSFEMPPNPPTGWSANSPPKWVLIGQAEAEAEAKAKGTQPPEEPVLQKEPQEPQASKVLLSPYQEAKLGMKPFKSPAKSTASQKVTAGVPSKLSKKKTVGIAVTPAVSLKPKLSAPKLSAPIKSKPSTPLKSKPLTPLTPKPGWVKSKSQIPNEFKAVKFHDNDDEKLDAWPDLKDIIQTALSAKLACYVLQEISGADYSKAPTPAKPLWPRPVPPKGTSYHTL